MTFGKSLFLTRYRLRSAIYMPPKTKNLAIDQTMVTLHGIAALQKPQTHASTEAKKLSQNRYFLNRHML